MASISPGETIRARVERALAEEQIDLTNEQGRTRAAELIDECIRAYKSEQLAGDGELLAEETLEVFRRELRDELIGLGAIAEQMLGDDEAQEWMINGPRRIFRDTGERIERVTQIAFADDRQLRAFLERLLEKVEGKRLDRITPRVEARLPDGSRITAAIPPVSSNGHPICSIRRFRLGASSLAELQELGFLSAQAAEFLTACVRAGKNIVIAGRVSSGKTTLLNALGKEIDAQERVVVCESSAELQLPRVLPNCVGYEARPASMDGLPPVTLEDLVSDALRMNPDRIIVGECRGPETMALLWSFATGHAGMTSIHGAVRRTRAQEPRPFRAHLRRSHRGRAGTRLDPRTRHRRPLRSAPRLQPRRAQLPAAADQRDRRGRRHRRKSADAQPTLRRRRSSTSLARRPAPLRNRTRQRRL